MLFLFIGGFDLRNYVVVAFCFIWLIVTGLLVLGTYKVRLVIARFIFYDCVKSNTLKHIVPYRCAFCLIHLLTKHNSREN